MGPIRAGSLRWAVLAGVIALASAVPLAFAQEPAGSGSTREPAGAAQEPARSEKLYWETGTWFPTRTRSRTLTRTPRFAACSWARATSSGTTIGGSGASSASSTTARRSLPDLDDGARARHRRPVVAHTPDRAAGHRPRRRRIRCLRHRRRQGGAGL